MYLIRKNIGYLKNKINYQAVILLLASLISMAFMLGVNFFLTRLLDKESFGNYSLIINVFLFASIIFNFGYFYSLSKMIALTNSSIKQRELYSVGIITVIFLSIVMSFFLYLYVYLVIPEVNKEVIDIYYAFIPLSFFFLFNVFNEWALQGSNKITLLAFSRVAPKGFFLFLLFYLYFFYKDEMSLKLIFYIYFTSFLISYLYIFYNMKPKISNIIKNTKKIHQSNKQFGFNVYLGSVVAVGSTSLSGILISYFGVNNVEVGYYAISQQFAAPLSLVPNVLATVYFKKFATSDSINKKLLFFVYGISFISFITVYFISKPVVLIVYGNEYLDSVKILRLLIFGILLYGIADVYNRFLLSKGQGKVLRNTAYIVGIVLLFFNIILISKLGAIGASIATIISGLTYLIVIVVYYNKIKKLA